MKNLPDSTSSFFVFESDEGFPPRISVYLVSIAINPFLPFSSSVIDIIVKLCQEVKERTETIPSKAGLFQDDRMRCYYELLENLDPQVKWELIALMWLGRDPECRAEEFDELVKESKGHGVERAAYYLLSKPLHEYLPKGIEKIKAKYDLL